MQVDAHQPVHDADVSPTWLAPLAIVVAWFAALFERIARLKRIRATTHFKPEWRDCWRGLRESEWHRHQMLAQGAALLLAGKTLDDAHYVNLPVPDDYGGPCPATPYEMKRCFAVVADWLRDPEEHIRRHVARIARRTDISGCPLRHASHATSPSLRLEDESRHARRTHRSLSSSNAQHCGRWHACACTHDGGGSRDSTLSAQPRAPPTIAAADCPVPQRVSV